MDDIIKALTKPEKLYSYSDIISNEFLKDHPDINETGIYAWYFKEIPPHVTEDNHYPMVMKNNKTLLYIGKSSSAPLENRINKHYTGKARHSTLRMSLGVLLYGKDSTPLRMMSHNDPSHFSLTDEYEEKLSAWMNENAFVCWVASKKSGGDEKVAIKNIGPPFNIRPGTHSFRKKLSLMRFKAQCGTLDFPTIKELKAKATNR